MFREQSPERQIATLIENLDEIKSQNLSLEKELLEAKNKIKKLENPTEQNDSFLSDKTKIQLFRTAKLIFFPIYAVLWLLRIVWIARHIHGYIVYGDSRHHFGGRIDFPMDVNEELHYWNWGDHGTK